MIIIESENYEYRHYQTGNYKYLVGFPIIPYSDSSFAIISEILVDQTEIGLFRT